MPSCYFFHRLRCPCAALLLLALVAWPGAQAASAQPSGLSSFPLLRRAPSARAAALGGALSAAYGADVNAFFYNPALLSEATHGAVSLSYLNHLRDLNAGTFAYSDRAGRQGTWGLGLRYMSYGAFEGYDESGLPEGTFHAGEAALTGGWARALTPRLRLGAAVHLAYAGIASADAAALAADVGLLYCFPDRRIALSLALNRIGIGLKTYADAPLELPTDLRLGLVKRLRYLPVTLFIDVYGLLRRDPAPPGLTSADRTMRHLVLGSEIHLADVFTVRLGYNHRRRLNVRQSDRLDLAGLSAGFGLHIAHLRFDYAYASWSALGGVHVFTLRIATGRAGDGETGR